MTEVMKQNPAVSSIAAPTTSPTTSTMRENRLGFGFAPAKEIASVPAQKKIDVNEAAQACPVDPMERLKCDSCQ